MNKEITRMRELLVHIKPSTATYAKEQIGFALDDLALEASKLSRQVTMEHIKSNRQEAMIRELRSRLSSRTRKTLKPSSCSKNL